MEAKVRSGKIGLETKNYMAGVLDENGKEYRTVVQAVDLAQALLALKQKFQKEISLLAPDQKWITDNDGVDFYIKVMKLEKKCFSGCFQVPSEIQFWDTPRILHYYSGKNIAGHFTK
jgi:hypothetical protein